MKSFVEPLADYFEANNLIFEHKHSIQLTSTDMSEGEGSIILKMVQSSDIEEIPENEKENIQQLEEDLKEAVFLGANFRIAICNENFYEIEK
ncbi:hypothetical protein K6119_01610 [Paracrocinitomix mangrovi]|uniref:hypothetical protein n=1 Tax=Paracrocinitomix mangrovi TaxID=2862509 RepID=UPI001C8DC45B|nr:hypothetical protein [Paracrocinitomix mangrovi]UKN02213.1 hypothetical protein K6119_01610 [Paracrocinitomix mangrovi]